MLDFFDLASWSYRLADMLPAAISSSDILRAGSAFVIRFAVYFAIFFIVGTVIRYAFAGQNGKNEASDREHRQ